MPTNRSTIDLRIGEARLLRDLTCKLFDLRKLSLDMEPDDWEYQSNGYKPLVRFLERKYGAPVIITNGANQALHAATYALKHKGYDNVGFRVPFWNRIPEIMKTVGIRYSTFKSRSPLSEENLKIDSYLLTTPNNPDGYLPTLDTLRTVVDVLKDQDIPLIHDAVYYTRTYLPADYPIENVGDIQIYSASKTYGLSSLRIGYMVVHNTAFHKLLSDYMELSTVGVSVPAQKLFLKLLQRGQELPMLENEFNKASSTELKKAKQIFKTVNLDLLELPESFENSCGVFAWVKPLIPKLFEQLDIEVLDGSIFGMPEYRRLNLAAGNDLITEVVSRINDV